MSAEKKLSYEAARDELAQVVESLESGSETLEESLKLWERGEELAKICQEWLDGALPSITIGAIVFPRRATISTRRACKASAGRLRSIVTSAADSARTGPCVAVISLGQAIRRRPDLPDPGAGDRGVSLPVGGIHSGQRAGPPTAYPA